MSLYTLVGIPQWCLKRLFQRHPSVQPHMHSGGVQTMLAGQRADWLAFAIDKWRVVARLCQRTLNSPSQLQQALSDTQSRKARAPRPFGDVQAFAVKCDPVCRALVSGLFAPCGPSTVVRTVWTIVVHALDGVTWRRLRSHVVQKRPEVGSPARTDRDTAPAVVYISLIGFGVTPPLHLGPCSVLGDARSKWHVTEYTS